jgi:hypothetical protein
MNLTNIFLAGLREVLRFNNRPKNVLTPVLPLLFLVDSPQVLTDKFGVHCHQLEEFEPKSEDLLLHKLDVVRD